MGTIEHIFIAPQPGAPMVALTEVEAITDRGLAGDRNANDRSSKSPGQQLTLIEGEFIAAYNAEPQHAAHPLALHEPRRNLVTRGVRLNDLCGTRFRIGEIEVEGVKLCEPCATFERRTHAGIVKFFTQKGGLRARIVRGGTLRVGDAIHAASATTAAT